MNLSRTLSALLFAAAIVPAHANQEAGLPGAYLNFAGSPRAIGLNRALVGMAEGPDAVAWNPAGLAFLRPNMLSFMHTQTGEGAYVESLGYAQPIYRFGGIGAHYIRLDSGSLPQTDQYNKEVGTFHDVQQTLMAGYGVAPIRGLAFGGTFKFSQQSLAGASASGWGLDLGVMQTLPYGLSWGARVQNVMTPTLRYETGEDQFPRLLTVGVAARLLNNRLLITNDFERSLDAPQALQWRIGVEGIMLRVLALRGGFDFTNREFTLGFAYRFGRQEVSYANTMNGVGSAHHIGLDYMFGGYDVVVHANPESFSPIGLKKNTTISIAVNHTRKIYTWEFEIRDQGRNLVRSVRGSGSPPPELEWDGTNQDGIMMAAGPYTYTLTLTDVDNRKETTPPQIVRLSYGTPQDAIEIQSR
jgi:hypothetical protein